MSTRHTRRNTAALTGTVSISLPARAYKQVAHSATMKITTPARPKSPRTCNHKQNVRRFGAAHSALTGFDYPIGGQFDNKRVGPPPKQDDGPSGTRKSRQPFVIVNVYERLPGAFPLIAPQVLTRVPERVDAAQEYSCGWAPGFHQGT